MALENSSVGSIDLYAKKVKTLTKELLDFLKTEYSFQDDEITVNWGDNSSYLFSSKGQKNLLIQDSLCPKTHTQTGNNEKT